MSLTFFLMQILGWEQNQPKRPVSKKNPHANLTLAGRALAPRKVANKMQNDSISSKLVLV